MLPYRPLIALVDDDEAVLTALRRLLRAWGGHAEVFASGRDFLDSLADHVPDCVVLDVQMPDLNGWEIQAELAALGLRLPLIIITADVATRELAQRAGAVAFLHKPFTDQQLLAAIDAAVGPGQKEGGAACAVLREISPAKAIPNPRDYWTKVQ